MAAAHLEYIDILRKGNPLERAQKDKLIAELHDNLKDTGVVVVAHYAGLNVAQMTEYRQAMKTSGGRVKVAKNRLVIRALENTPSEGIRKLFTGPTLIAFSDDPVTAPKVTVEFAKKHNQLVVLGGAMGETVLDTDGVQQLASLPSLDELRGRLVGLIQAPAGKIARTLNEPAAQLARVFAAYGNE